MSFETLAVHAGAEPDPATGAVAPPIHLSTTFEHGPEARGPAGTCTSARPTRPRRGSRRRSRRSKAARRRSSFASGLAAGAASSRRFRRARTSLPGRRLLRLPRRGAGVPAALGRSRTDSSTWPTSAALRARSGPRRSSIWAETPSNPLMKVADLAAADRDRARRRGALLVVDNTFATPALQRPLELGADVVLHSTTKYLGGHSDVQGGALVFATARRALREGRARAPHPRRRRLAVQLLAGRCAACARSPAAMERHSANGIAVARALAAHPGVAAVHYPGLESHPGHDVARRQMTAFGGMLSFRVRGGRDAAGGRSRLKLFVVATSLGGIESLIEHRASSEGPARRRRRTCCASRRSRAPDDLIEDLEQALG